MRTTMGRSRQNVVISLIDKGHNNKLHQDITVSIPTVNIKTFVELRIASVILIGCTPMGGPEEAGGTPAIKPETELAETISTKYLGFR